ncbi:MAG: MFS transporter, partial [Steroidobacteraceae bacterium]
MSTHVAASGPNGAEPAVSARPQDAQQLRLFVFALFFFFGGITSLNDVVIPKLKGLFTLSYAEVMLVQSAFFAAYFFISLPAAALVRRIGYIRAAVLGLVLMAAGCLLFIPASFSARFGMFLAALFVLAAGITVVQVVNNPLISMLGNPATAHSRLTFAQAFNSLGTTVFPYLGALLFLGSLSTVDPQTLRGAALAAYRFQETHVVARAYLGLAVGLAVLAALMWRLRNRLVEPHVKESGLRQALVLLRHTRFGYGALCIFLYVGAEVTIGSLMVSYLTQASVLALSQR